MTMHKNSKFHMEQYLKFTFKKYIHLNVFIKHLLLIILKYIINQTNYIKLTIKFLFLNIYF